MRRSELCKKPGRKRDHTLDAQIIEAALGILAEEGFDRMTMDMVAARAQSGKATVYRRWPSKVELVKEALVWMSRQSIELGHLPDTGSLREDLLAVVKPHSIERGERKLRILAQLGSFFTEHRDVASDTMAEIFAPWTEVNRKLMQRAIERGQIPPTANIDLACEIIVSMTSYYSQVICKVFDKTAYATLLDTILLPALKRS